MERFNKMKYIFFVFIDGEGKKRRAFYKGDLAELLNELEEKNLKIVRYISISGNIFLKTLYKVGIKDLMLFCKDFATLYKVGVPIKECINIIYDQCDSLKLKKSLKAVNDNLRKGYSLSEAFLKNNYEYSSFFITSIKLGEESGNIDSVLYNLGKYYERKIDFQSKIKQSLTYPILVIIVTFFVATYIILNVIPQFISLFEGLNAEIPWYTLKLISLSTFLSNNFLIILPSILTLFLLFTILVARAHKRWNIFYKMPIMKKYFFELFQINFIESFSILLNSGINISKALTLIEDSNKNKFYKQNISLLIELINNGISLSEALLILGGFNKMVVSMVTIGEKSGKLDHMMISLKDILQKKYYKKLKTISELVHPFIMILLGIFVLSIFLVILSPVFDSLSSFNY